MDIILPSFLVKRVDEEVSRERPPGATYVRLGLLNALISQIRRAGLSVKSYVTDSSGRKWVSYG